MRVIFAGPSIHGAAVDLAGIELQPPAAQGDVLDAVLGGANVIGLVDGAFEARAAVWHKEILHALSEGVAVVGGASMGALRAAECAPFGMEPVGQIAHALISGAADDDAMVAITHGPVEIGSPPLTEALIDCEATIAEMERLGFLSPVEAERATTLARKMHYKDRTAATLAIAVHPRCPQDFKFGYASHRVSVKTRDAIAVIGRVRSLPDVRTRSAWRWQLKQPPLWRETVEAATAAGIRSG